MSADNAVFIVKKNATAGGDLSFYVVQASASVFDELWLDRSSLGEGEPRWLDAPDPERLSALLGSGRCCATEESALDEAGRVAKDTQYGVRIIDLSVSTLQLRTEEIIGWVGSALIREGKKVNARMIGMRPMDPDVPITGFFIDVPVEDEDGRWNLSLCDERVVDLLVIEAAHRGLRVARRQPGSAWMFDDRADPLRATLHVMSVDGRSITIEREFGDDCCANCSGDCQSRQ